jgi:hypothetical protein
MMPDSNIPMIKVLIKPQFDSNDHVKGLPISLTIQSPQLQTSSTLVYFLIATKSPPLQSYINSLKATDEEGPLARGIRG